MTPENEARRRQQRHRARQLRLLAEQIVRELIARGALSQHGGASDAGASLSPQDPPPDGRPHRCTYDAQGRLTSITDP
jgi:hypothetical protein